MGELGVDFVVAEKILNHSLGGVFATYDRAEYTDKRRIAMTLWANELNRILVGDPSKQLPR